MGRIIKKSIWVKMTISIFAMIISILFIGAGANQVTEERSGRKDCRKTEIEKWKIILSEVGHDIPNEHRKEWYKIASKNPELLLKVMAEYKSQ